MGHVVVYALEWGRWGPPQGGTYHLDPDCWTLHRGDSDREPRALPWSRGELRDSDEWQVCGHCRDVEPRVRADVPISMEDVGVTITDPWQQVGEQEDRGSKRVINEHHNDE